MAAASLQSREPHDYRTVLRLGRLITRFAGLMTPMLKIRGSIAWGHAATERLALVWPYH